MRSRSGSATATREGGEPLSITMANVSVNLGEREQQLPPRELRNVVFDVDELGVSYGSKKALEDVSLEIYRNFVTAFIGPSGCGKSTFIRCFNRMNDLIPTATTRIEDLMHELKREYTIIVVTHNMQQAARIADMTAFFTVNRGDEGRRTGVLVEYDATSKIFTQPSDKRTEDYVTGRFG